MEVYGYVRSETGEFEYRKRKVIETAIQMNLRISELIEEKSSENYDEMRKLKILLGKKNFVLIVSDTSDLLEGMNEKIVIPEKLMKNNVFLIDANFPKFDLKMIIEKYGKENPVEFFSNSMIVDMEIYMRKREKGNFQYSDIKEKLEKWESRKKKLIPA